LTPQGRADLHVHTTASDGALSPAAVVRDAAGAGLAAVAIADHDTLDGIPEATQAARRFPSLRVVPAVEINTDHGRTEVHILGYFPDLDDGPFREFLRQQVASRGNRASLMVERLRGLGFDITMERVAALATGGVIGRPHVAAALAEKGYVASFHEAMERLLARGRPGYVPRHKLSPGQAVRAVVRASGVPVLAHPGAPPCDELIDDLVTDGLQGVEAYHPLHTPAQQKRFARAARERGLVVTGGSDFHGHGAGITGGPRIGEVTVPVETVQELLSRVNRFL